MSISDQNNGKETPQPSGFPDLKSKRDEYLQEAREQKRENILNQDRNRILENEQKMEEEHDREIDKKDEDQTLEEMEKQWIEQTFSLDDLPDLVDAVCTTDKLRQLYGLIGLNKIIIEETNVHLLIDSNLVPILIKLLSKEEAPQLQKQVVSLILAISTGTTEQTQVIVDEGALDCLFRLLTCASDDETLRQILVTIGNIGADNVDFRDLILNNHGLDPILEIVNQLVDPALIKAGARAISVLCRRKPLAAIEHIEKAAPTLGMLFQREQDINVLVDTAWALSFILPRPKTEETKTLSKTITPIVIRYMDRDEDLGVPCLKIMTHLLTLAENANDIKNSGPDFMPRLFKMLQSQSSSIRREICYLLSNITAGSLRDINMIFNNPYYIDMLIRVATSDVPKVAREAAWVLANAMKNMGKNKVSEVLDLGVLDCFLCLLDSNDELTLQVVLEALKYLLYWGTSIAQQTNTENEPLRLLANKGGLQKLRNLQQAKNYSVSVGASGIIEIFDLQNEILVL